MRRIGSLSSLPACRPEIGAHVAPNPLASTILAQSGELSATLTFPQPHIVPAIDHFVLQLALALEALVSMNPGTSRGKDVFGYARGAWHGC